MSLPLPPPSSSSSSYTIDTESARDNKHIHVWNKCRRSEERSFSKQLSYDAKQDWEKKRLLLLVLFIQSFYASIRNTFYDKILSEYPGILWDALKREGKKRSNEKVETSQVNVCSVYAVHTAPAHPKKKIRHKTLAGLHFAETFLIISLINKEVNNAPWSSLLSILLVIGDVWCWSPSLHTIGLTDIVRISVYDKFNGEQHHTLGIAFFPVVT